MIKKAKACSREKHNNGENFFFGQMTNLSITVEFMSAIRPADAQQKARYTFEEPITLSQLLDSFGFKSPEKSHLIVIVNKSVQNSFDYTIKDGDEIFVTLPIGGG